MKEKKEVQKLDYFFSSEESHFLKKSQEFPLIIFSDALKRFELWPHSMNSLQVFFKMGQTRPFFHLFSSFCTN